MKLTKQLEAEVLATYQASWDALFRGDIKTFASLLDDQVVIYGSASGEIFTTKKAAEKFYKATADQITGKVDLRKRKIGLKAVNNTVVVHELCELFFLTEKGWVFYGPARITDILEKKGKTWKIIHHHTSFPDSRTIEGEQFATEKIKAENLLLRDAVQRRTIELEHKNRELEIETALEKVRSVAMGMKKAEDMLSICQTISTELQKLGIKEIRNVQTAIIHKEKGTYTNYEFYEKHNKHFTTEVSYTNHSMSKAFVKKMLEGPNEFFKRSLKGKKVQEWYAFQKKATNQFADKYLTKASSLNYYWYSLGPVALGVSTYAPLNKEEEELVVRFKNVFELAYRRYLDIETATAQAREAQIEAALERVRAASLAMQDSSALSEIIFKVYGELTKLDAKLDRCFIMIVHPENKGITWWMAGHEGLLAENGFFVQMNQHPSHLMYLDYCKKRKKKWTYLFEGKEKRDWDRFGFNKTELAKLPEPIKAFMAAAKKVHLSGSSDQFGSLVTGSFEPLPEEQQEIISRFAVAFNQAYIRFLDLQKAEAQAREAQIEAALERVRSLVTSMQKSDDLFDIVVNMRREFIALRHEADYFWHMRWGQENYELSMTSDDGSRLGMVINVPGFVHEQIPSLYEWEKGSSPIFVLPLNAEQAWDYIDKMNTHGSFELIDPHAPSEDDIRAIGGITFIIARTTHGEIGYSLAGEVHEPPKESLDTLIRFAGVFDLAYKRFEDLKDAEIRNRETQIELALEKVRSRTMAMQHSNELSEAAAEMFAQMDRLGVHPWSCGFNIVNLKKKIISQWVSSGDGRLLPPFESPSDQDVFVRFTKAFQKGESIYIEEMGGDSLEAHYQYMLSIPAVGKMAQDMKATGIRFPTFQVFNLAYFKYGYLLFITYEQVPEFHEIFKRFARVFEQTYTRFLDLKNAEAQAREAQVEAALEKVRSRSLAMQKPEELTEVAVLLRNEMGQLGVEELETSSIYIVDKAKRQAECWYAIKDIREENKRLVSDEMTIIFADSWVGREMWKFFQSKKEQASIIMKGANRKEWINYCAAKSNVLQGYYGDEIPERIYHLVKFNGGYMGAASPGEISAESWDLLRRAAAVFSLAYTRFNDLQVAEAHARQAEQDLMAIKEAKQKAEEALTELQATQKQLIQSEKMASLGELTAGIAHEIQNPLNFVNNFSEVSTELIKEMVEEVDKGNTEEVKAIAEDLVGNLEKIHFHGERAAAIVKGMLQHSRSSSGVKELTDINALCDEYLRLAYHGLRAKDKSFNARFETNFDASIGNINIMPQEIGRVVLNLINNAFYAVNERKKLNEPGYEPTVTVTTKKEDGKTVIAVADNGTGIPKKALDKIFHPFFTTKPTGQGTGLGLSLSYDIVTKAHGGDLLVATKENEGSTFIIQLPVS